MKVASAVASFLFPQLPSTRLYWKMTFRLTSPLFCNTRSHRDRHEWLSTRRPSLQSHRAGGGASGSGGHEPGGWAHLRGVVEAAPAERSVQLVHLVLQGDRRSPRIAHPFGHDVPLGGQRLGLGAWTREAGRSHAQQCAPCWPRQSDLDHSSLSWFGMMPNKRGGSFQWSTVFWCD